MVVLSFQPSEAAISTDRQGLTFYVAKPHAQLSRHTPGIPEFIKKARMKSSIHVPELALPAREIGTATTNHSATISPRVQPLLQCVAPSPTLCENGFALRAVTAKRLGALNLVFRR
jgi:hypothetical protein